MTCNKQLDIVLVLDGSGSMGQRGWDAQIKAAEAFIAAFDVANTEAKISVIVYSGPWWWSVINKCLGKSSSVDMAKDCKINTVVSMESGKSSNMAQVKQTVKNLKWPSGMTLTSLALFRAKKELELTGRAAKSVVVVFTDGRPFRDDLTLAAAKEVRKTSRLVWVPVASQVRDWKRIFYPLATRLPKENIVPVSNFDALKDPKLVKSLIADICPSNLPR